MSLPDLDLKYELVDLPFNLMGLGDVFVSSAGEWFLVTELDRFACTLTTVSVSGRHRAKVDIDRRFFVLLPENYKLAVREFNARF